MHIYELQSVITEVADSLDSISEFDIHEVCAKAAVNDAVKRLRGLYGVCGNCEYLEGFEEGFKAAKRDQQDG